MSKRTPYSVVSLFTDSVMLLVNTPASMDALVKMNSHFYTQFEEAVMVDVTIHGNKQTPQLHVDAFAPKSDDESRLDRMEAWVRGYLAAFVSNVA